MGRHSKATKKKIHKIAHACTYRSTTGAPVWSTGNAGEINEQEEPIPPVVNDGEQELNEAEYSTCEPGDQWGEDTGWDTEEEHDGLVGDEDEELSEPEGEDLCESLRVRVEGEIKALANAEQASQTAYAAIMQELSAKDWRKLEAQRKLDRMEKEREPRESRGRMHERRNKRIKNCKICESCNCRY
jgi:hypothetical protein